MRKLIVVVLLVVALVVGADLAAAAAAEHVVATQLRQQLGLSRDPSVRINGFPFLTQALAGRYPAIDVAASGLSVQRLHNLAVEATLYDVDAPLSQVIAGNLQSVRVARVDGRVRITDSDLGQAIGVEDLRIQQPTSPEGSPADPASGSYAPIQLVASTHVAGQRLQIVGIGVIELAGKQVRITINEVRPSADGTGTVNLPRGLRHTLLTTLSTDVNPGTLPFAVTPTKVWVQTGSVVVEGRATNVTLH